jgi:hypothetical protein
MAGNDNERTFVPAEIDALEDALELSPMSALTLPSALDDDARARIHAALVRYRAIEHHAQALLRVEPPASILADVIARARAAAAEPAAVSPTPAAEVPSFWLRLRALWIVPSLAAVGATALVLVMVTNDAKDEAAVADAPARVASAERADAKSDGATPQAPPPIAQATDLRPAEEELQRGIGLVDDPSSIDAAKADADAEAEPFAARTSVEEQKRRTKREAPQDPAPEPVVTPSAGPKAPKSPAKSNTTPSAKPSSNAGGRAMPGGVPTPAEPQSPRADNLGADEKDKTSVATRLSQADTARKRGDCTAARVDYDHVIERGTSKQRARARAGIALCLERAGDETGARALIDQARKDDAAIDAWVDANR